MAKSLVDKLREFRGNLRRGFRNVIFSAFAGLFLYGAQCVPNPPPKPDPEPDNNPPTANLYVEPTYGQAPLEVLIQLDGEDNIVEYKVEIDIGNDETIEETISQSTPIDITKYFDAGDIKIYGQVIDSHDAIDEKSLSVIVSTPYDPRVDLSSIPESEKNFNEESQTIINLPTPYDPNPEDEPVWYTNATPEDVNMNGISEVNVISLQKNQFTNQYELTLKGNLNEIGIYQVKLELENVKGERGEVSFTGEIYNLVDILGRLQDNETDSNQAGVIRVYEDNSSLDPPRITNLYDYLTNSNLEEILIDNLGNFNFQINSRVSQAIVQARLDIGSYVRSVKLDGTQDYSDLIVRAVPNTDLSGYGITRGDFKKSIKYLNAKISFGLMKYNIQNVEIVDIDLGNGYLSTDDINMIYNKILDPNDIGGYIKERILNVQRDDLLQHPIPEDNKHYDSNGRSTSQGWVIISRNNNLLGSWQGDTYVSGSGVPMTIGKASIRIKLVNNTVISHEFGHALAFPYDYTESTPVPPTLSGDKTVMDYDFIPVTTSFADKKAARIVYEDTYSAGESLDDIMRLDWGFSSP